MKFTFFAKQFLVVLAGAFVVLVAAALVRGRSWHQTLTESALWAFISATIFVVAAVYRVRRGRACAVCADPGQGERTVKDGKRP